MRNTPNLKYGKQTKVKARAEKIKDAENDKEKPRVEVFDKVSEQSV